MKKTTEAYLIELLDRYPALKTIEDHIYAAAESLIHLYQYKGKLLVCGNGGSAADSLHIVGELMKSFKQYRSIPIELRNKLEKYENGYDLGPQRIEYAVNGNQTNHYSQKRTSFVACAVAYNADENHRQND